MPTRTSSLRVLALTAALSFAGGASAEIAQTPLTIANAVKPNVVMILDDSGSMDFETLFPTNDGALWWNTQSSNRNFFGAEEAGRFNYNNAGNANNTWKKYAYLFPNGSGSGNRSLTDGTHDHFAVPPVLDYAFARSPDYNRQYYNPQITYRPWNSRGSTTFADAVASAAVSDPVRGGSTIDLTSDLTSSDSNWTFKLFSGMRRANGNITDRTRDETFTYYPATYYMVVNELISLPWGGTCSQTPPDPAAYTSFVADTSELDDVDGVDAIAPDGRCLRRYEIKSGNTFPSGRSYADEMQNFANWFVYHRKRHQALRAGLGSAFDQFGNMRIGTLRINNRTDIVMRDIETERSDLYDDFYALRGSGGTPNREALNFAGSQFDTNDDIIQYACQQNYALQFTDGFSNPWTNAGVGNADGAGGALWGSPYADSYSNTIADIAAHYYAGPLRSGDFDAGKVPVPPVCSGGGAPDWVDCNRDLHMNTFGITLGAQGAIFGRTHDNVRDAYADAPSWQEPSALRSPVQVDDLYHAALNGRGEMLDARSTDELAGTLSTALRAILDRVVSSASVVATNSTRLDTETLVFQARFNSESWSGEVLAFGINPDGSIGTLRWDAGTLVPAPLARRIYTSTNGTTQVDFTWSSLSAAQRAALDLDRDGNNDGRGSTRLDWLRGDRSQEFQNGGVFRNRARVLGDIVNSSPAFVSNQNYGYERLPLTATEGSTYQTFRQSQATRTKMLYVGANDGMLHGFNAETGVEAWAYVPSSLIAELSELTDPDYRHRYYVDGTPTAHDAYFNGQWRTVLATSLGAGGRSVMAFDATSPPAVNLLWEFTHADLGYVIGRPSIARMQNGRWAVIFGSGYGLDRSAKLFIVDAETGALMTTAPISTVRSQDEASAAANGMSPPLPVDVDGDRVVDYIYAGDLYGNLWKFDVSANNANQWGVAFSSGNRPQPLFTACASGNAGGPFSCAAGSRQPITMRPEAGLGPNNGQRIYFGTGKYFEVGDNLVSPPGAVQSFYAIEDDNATPVIGRSVLTEQRILSESQVGSFWLRTTTDTALATNSRGWYMDLLSPVNGNEGERAVSAPILRSGRIIFTTLIPSADPCEAGGTSWLMELDAEGGGRLPLSPFDVNDDGVFDERDNVPGEGGASTPPSGVRSGVGIIQTPAIIEAGSVEYKIGSGSTGEIETIRERGRDNKGRTSWRQLWP